VTRVPDSNGSTTSSVLKVVYLLAVTATIFVVPALAATRPARWLAVPALLALQVVILLACRIRITEIVRPVRRLKWLFLFLIGCYVLLPAESPAASDFILHWRVPLVGWLIPLNLTGLERAALMCLQILTLLLASTVIRLSGTGSDLVDGLRALRLPDLFVYSLDRTLELLGGATRSDRDRTKAAGQSGMLSTVKRLLRGDIGGFVQTIRTNIERAGEHPDHESNGRLSPQLVHDIGIVTGIALCMASIKVLKLLPGLPFAPGHKALLLFPLYALASRLTHSGWGGTAAGSIMGVIGFLQGDGRFGVLEILKHVAPGLLIDLTGPVVRRLPIWSLGYCFLGLAAAAGRVTTELVLVLLLGARAEVYLFPAAVLVPNLLAGFLSGFVTIFVLRAFVGSTKVKKDRDAQTETKPDEAAQILSRQLAGEPPKLGASVGAEIVTAADRTQGIATQQASSQTLCMRRCSVRNALKKVIVVLPILAATAYPDRAGPAAATEQGAVRVAAAADLKFTMGEIVEAFRRERPAVNVLVTYGSSGNFYAQLSNHAPFDIFFSADVDYPRRLIREGLAFADSEFLYGIGRLVVWVPRTSPIEVEKIGMQVLLSPSVRRIAIANPRHAPYGRAAEAAMKSLGVYDQVKDRLVFGDSVMQAAQFVDSGGAEVGIISGSLALAPPLRDKGRFWEVPINAYPRREQGGVILSWAQDRAAAEALRDFVLREGGRAILRRHGFRLQGEDHGF